MRNKSAFSALETLTAFFIIGLLIAMISLVVDPQRRLAETRNSKRSSDIIQISSAINQYMLDNHESPPGIDGIPRILGTARSGCDIGCWEGQSYGVGAADCLDLKSYLAPQYLSDIPMDPQGGSPEITYYAVSRESNDRFVVYSCNSELGRDISIIQ